MRFAYRLWSLSVDPRNLVFIDETGVHLALTRLSGRAPKGERLYDSESPGNRGQNISLIGAMSIDGLIEILTVVGSVNTDVFLFYIQEILIPQLWPGAIVLMDNLPVHHKGGDSGSSCCGRSKASVPPSLFPRPLSD